MVNLQAEPVYRFYDHSEQLSEVPRDLLHLLVKRLLVEIFVDVPHQVNEAFLLLASKCIVCGIKIGDQTPRNSCRIFWALPPSRLSLYRYATSSRLVKTQTYASFPATFARVSSACTSVPPTMFEDR